MFTSAKKNTGELFKAKSPVGTGGRASLSLETPGYAPLRTARAKRAALCAYEHAATAEADAPGSGRGAEQCGCRPSSPTSGRCSGP